MVELLITIILGCIVGMILNSSIVGSPKMDKFYKFIANKFF